MAVSVAGNVRKRARENAGTIVFQIEQAADHERALRGLQAAADEIRSLTDSYGQKAASYVSDPIGTDAGPFVFVDGAAMSRDQLESLGGIVSRAVERAGVGDAIVTIPAGSGILTTLDEIPNLVEAIVTGPDPGLAGRGKAPLPADWVTAARDWLTEGSRGLVHARLAGSVTMNLGLDRIERVIESAYSARAELVLAAEHSNGLLYAVHFTYNQVLLLGLGGKALTASSLMGSVADLKECVHSISSLTYAGITFEPTFGSLGNGHYGGPELVFPFLNPPTWEELADKLAVDAFHWQVLTEGHIDRYGSVPPGAEQVIPGRWTLTIASPFDWWPPRPTDWPEDTPDNEQTRRVARELLGPLLLRRDSPEIGELLAVSRNF